MQIKEFFDIMMLVIIFMGVLGMTYFATKKMATFNKKMAFNKNMQTVEILQLSQGQYLCIVKIGNEYHLFGTAKESVNYCIKLDEENLNLQVNEEKSFHDYLNQFKKGKQVNKDEK